MAVAGGDKTSLEFTPTWVVALVCLSIVVISFIVNRFFRCTRKLLKKRKKWPLRGASRKIKDELMVLGFISLLLAASQTKIGKICISDQLANTWLPCKKPDSSSTVANFTTSSFPSSGTRGRRLLTMASDTTDYCSQKGKVPLLSVEAIHQLDIFMFVLAIFHVVLCLLKVLSMTCQWKCLKIYDGMTFKDGPECKVHQMVLTYYSSPPGLFKCMMSVILKGITSMSLYEYVALSANFMGGRATRNPGKDFQEYIMGALKKEFRKMIGISWYLWLFAVIFLLVNVAGWNAYFWISFMPLILWLLVHFELEGIIRRVATKVVKKLSENGWTTCENGVEKIPFEILDDYFWFRRPYLTRNLIHFVLFENSLQLAFSFFILFQYGFHSCMMGKVGFVVPRIAIGTLVQVLCMCRTIPLYANIKSQMGLKQKQSDKWDKINKIKMHLEEYLSDEHIEKCLHDLNGIKKRLKENGMDEDEEMRIVTWISGLIDNRKDRETEPNAPGETNIELTRMGSGEGSVADKITEAGEVDSIEDIEAQNRRPSLHQQSK